MFEGDRGLDRLEKALAEHRQSMFSVTPMVMFLENSSIALNLIHLKFSFNRN